jgi:hypothetical protein
MTELYNTDNLKDLKFEEIEFIEDENSKKCREQLEEYKNYIINEYSKRINKEFANLGYGTFNTQSSYNHSTHYIREYEQQRIVERNYRECQEKLVKFNDAFFKFYNPNYVYNLIIKAEKDNIIHNRFEIIDWS